MVSGSITQPETFTIWGPVCTCSTVPNGEPTITFRQFSNVLPPVPATFIANVQTEWEPLVAGTTASKPWFGP